MTREKRKGGIILQDAILFLLGSVTTGIIAYVTRHARADTNVKLQA